jgi:hypothetical protein
MDGRSGPLSGGLAEARATVGSSGCQIGATRSSSTAPVPPIIGPTNARRETAWAAGNPCMVQR